MRGVVGWAKRSVPTKPAATWWARRAEVGFTRLRHQNVSKSATADFDERAFAYLTTRNPL
jgi:hypothetical protein